MDFTRRTASAAIDAGHVIIKEDGSVVELDGLLIPSQDGGVSSSP